VVGEWRVVEASYSEEASGFKEVCVVEVGDARQAEGVVVNYLRELIRRAPRPAAVGKTLVLCLKRPWLWRVSNAWR